jgi:hypothetical protein
MRQSTIERLYFACGCGEGTLFGMISLLSYIGWIAARWDGLQTLSWLHLVGVPVVFVVSTGLGKCVGLWRAGRTLTQRVAQLQNLVQTRSVDVDGVDPGQLPLAQRHAQSGMPS